MVIMDKWIATEKGKPCKVTLENDGFQYCVKIDGKVYKKFVNKLFAVQLFNAI